MSEQEVFDAARAVSEHLDADVILFNQDIDQETAADFHVQLDEIKDCRKVVFLILVTLGGDPHAAYLIARELQLRYERVIICVAGDCYSAGTLIVCSAHELVITPWGQLGPLDAQIPKKDELFELLSGLTTSDALEELSAKAVETLTKTAVRLKRDCGWQLSFRTALDVAATMTAQMFGEIYKQIDPIRLGEDARALKVAAHYARILNRKSKNLHPWAVKQLTTAYPSHSCVIDAEEASDLFVRSREPSELESDLVRCLGLTATDASIGKDVGVLVLAPRPRQGDLDAPTADSPANSDEVSIKSEVSIGNGHSSDLARRISPTGAGSRKKDDR